jgi:LysM repeat protein
VTAEGPVPSAGATVCPFVALAEDRDRRADAPAEGNRCYAEKAPRRRDLIHQAEYCYSPRFPGCSIFLAWAARNAAQPAHLQGAAQRAWGAGVAMPDSPGDGEAGSAAVTFPGEGVPGGSAFSLPSPTPENGLFGPPPAAPAATSRTPDLDWVSASAWAEAPWDAEAEAEVEAFEELPPEDEESEPDEESFEAPEEALQGPKVPAALPMRRRPRAETPIRATGSGEWYYADPPGREPLVSRRGSLGQPLMLAVLALLIIALVAFLVPSLFGGDGGGVPPAGPASQSPGASLRAVVTQAPRQTPDDSPTPTPTPPQVREYTVKSGDTLSGIASKFKVSIRLVQCYNGITNPDRLQLGQKVRIPPDGYSCPPGWRRGSVETEPPDATEAPAASGSISPAA